MRKAFTGRHRVRWLGGSRCGRSSRPSLRLRNGATCSRTRWPGLSAASPYRPRSSATGATTTRRGSAVRTIRPSPSPNPSSGGSMRIAQCLSHAIESWYQLDLLSSLGYEVIDIGPYIDPAHPHVDIRPPLPDVPYHKDLAEAIEAGKSAQDPQEHLPDVLLEWLGDDGIVIYHHYLGKLFGQWGRIRDWKRGSSGRRIIWRSVGQSVANNEREAQPFRLSGLERVAYSPRETNIPDYSGHDAVIRFWGHQDDEPWSGDERRVIQVSQHLRQREPFTNWTFWDSATR